MLASKPTSGLSVYLMIERVLSFTCAPALSSAIIPTVLAEFKRQHPDVKTVMHDAADASLIQRVLSEDVEFSIGFFEHEPESVARIPLVVDYLCAVCQHRKTNKGRVQT